MTYRKQAFGLIAAFLIFHSPAWAGDIESDITRGQFTGDGGFFELGARLAAGNNPLVGVPNGGNTEKSAALSVTGRYQRGPAFIELNENLGLNVGLNVWGGDTWWFDAVISQAHDEINPDDIRELRNSNLKKRERDLPLGIRATGYLGNTLVQITLLSGDLRNEHDGYSVQSTLGQTWQKRNANFHLLVGALYDSDDVTHYYFGIDPNQSDFEYVAYLADDSLRVFAELGLTLALTENWVLRGKAKYTRLSDAITDSPIVEDNYESVAALALNYVF